MLLGSLRLTARLGEARSLSQRWMGIQVPLGWGIGGDGGCRVCMGGEGLSVGLCGEVGAYEGVSGGFPGGRASRANLGCLEEGRGSLGGR